jgi:SAM-dependent methyltransferase
MRRNGLPDNISSRTTLRFVSQFLENASEQDLDSSATLRIFKRNPRFAEKVLKTLSSFDKSENMLDLGCGYGLTTEMIGTCLGLKEIHGVDIDWNRIPVSEGRLSEVHKINLEVERLPFPDEHFDLVTSFGVLEHLRFYDNPIKEAHRVLKQNGILLISLPNLACWINRFLLLFGFHPRDVDISDSLAVGLPNFWPKDRREAFGHIHACTVKAMTELLENYGFATKTVFGVACIQDILSRAHINMFEKAILRITDEILSRRVGLSLRFFIIAQKRTE